METLLADLIGPVSFPGLWLIFILMGIVCAGAFVTSGFGIGGGVLVTPLFISVLPPKYRNRSLGSPYAADERRRGPPVLAPVG